MDHPWNSLVSCQQSVPHKVAVVDKEIQFTYDELHARCGKLGQFLQGRGACSGSSIGALLPNIHETMEVHFAAAWLGASVVNLNTRLVPHELAYIMQDSSPEIVIVHHNLLDCVVEALNQPGCVFNVKLVLVVRSLIG